MLKFHLGFAIATCNAKRQSWVGKANRPCKLQFPGKMTYTYCTGWSAGQLSNGAGAMTSFIRVVEQGDNSVHHVQIGHVIQVVHVPGSPIATVTTTDGKAFRISDTDYQYFLRTIADRIAPQE